MNPPEELLDRLGLPHEGFLPPKPLHPGLRPALKAYLERLGYPLGLEGLEGGAVVTGQQPGLLGGPAYTFYKAHTALALAQGMGGRALFWVASQDHDVEEVRRLYLLREERLETLELPLPPRPLARISLAPYREALEGFLGPWAREERVAYALEGGTLSEFFARLLLGFLGPSGLIPFDPMAPELATLFREALERELEDPLASAEAVNRGAEALKALGEKPALRRKPGATNLFLETDERRLLFYQGGQFFDGVRGYTKKELLEILEADPSRLTPAAGLRPVFQDLVLPTRAFVVGPNELRYVAELSGVYALHGLPFPPLYLRLRALVLEPPVRRILEAYGLDPWALEEEGEEAFLRALATRLEEWRRLEARFEEALEAVEALEEEAQRLFPNLLRPLRRFRHRLGGEGERLLRKALRLRLEEEGRFKAHLERLKLHLLPLGLPQERVLPFPMYALRHPQALDRLAEAPPRGRALLLL